MGCTESAHVIQNKKKVEIKEVKNVIQNEKSKQTLKIQSKRTIEQIPERGECFLIGCLSEKQQLFAHVKLQTMSINKMSIPLGGFVCNNFSSILEIQKGKYFISGGINYDLTKISDLCYFYYSNEHRVQKLVQMRQPRYTHSSIYVPETKSIYAVGGRYYGDDSQAILSSGEKYLIQQNKWIDLPLMNVNRCTCFLLTWNKVIYVFGGYTGPYQRSTKIQYLDQTQNSWKILDVQLNRGLEGANILPTNNNEITIFGGLTNSGPTDSVISINLKQKSIRSRKKLHQKRSLYKSFYKNGKIYFFGGDDEFTCQAYNIINQKSELTKNQFSFAIEDFDNFGFSTSSVCVPYKQQNLTYWPSNQKDQIVYIIGTTQQPFLCQLNISIPQSHFKYVPLGLKLYAHQGGVLISPNQILLFGGIEDDSLSVISSDTYLYDILKNTAKKVAKMNQNRYAFTYQFVKNHHNQQDFIYCFGGATSNTQGKLVFLNTNQRFSVNESKWELISPLPEKLISPMSLIFKQSIFVFGGTNDKNKKSQNIFMYQIKQNYWINLETKLMFGIEAGSITQISQNQFYIFGGLVQNGQSQGIWSLYFNQKTSNQQKQPVCIFQEKGKMNQKKSQHKIYQPRDQSFYVVFGGDKDPLTFYKKNLEQQSSDLLYNLKELFMNSLENLNHRNLKGYLMLSSHQNQGNK